ncbi:hypothetical protein [Spiroplasma floricola]|uniref:Transmembrane protein n=1 Tax=Spiroplasma floricola 23-6 TaxID=1336749 RepID=A0A2K8SCQ8_9MOLU|nr:hypothetical protein [Spiroplasma floricola]AUB31232.1 hypothetical protein SFLOR_v1c01710 [Spiroplasma floricola 23-6]
MKKEKNKEQKLKKINFKNFKSTSVFFMIIIVVFRTTMIAFWLVAPIILALNVGFDHGLKTLVEFIWALILKGENTTLATRITIDVAAPVLWFLMMIIMLFASVKPFFNKKTWGKRAYLAFSYIFWPILFTGIIYGIYFTIPFYEVGKETSPTAPDVDKTWQLWKSLKDTFTPYSGWMISLQCIYAIFVLFGIFSIFEAHMVRKRKLDYSDFFVKNKDQRSLYNQVIEGKIEFGEFDPIQVDKEVKRIKKETIAEERREKFEAIKKAEEERINKKNEKKQKKLKGKKANENEKDIKL